ncbi:hypothetical protein Tsubulata_043286 [Turnera subulata]|uniref:Uncharacterized protein n=1 Tax=Turnera subulata TaxID=218843 RepID=A0A9Q0JKZ6_9ROSI|nr:hypothetical protein Tsubulata_043286 [Turnera subulata]
MRSTARTCLSSILKVVNSTMGIVGIAMILYGLWMVSVWQRDMERSSFDFDSTSPCSFQTRFKLRIIWFPLYVLNYLLHNQDLPEDPTGRFQDFKEFVQSNMDVFQWIVMLFVSAQVFSSLTVFDLRVFLCCYKNCSNQGKTTCIWVSLSVSVGGFSILLAMILRSFGPTNRSNYDSDDEYLPARLPLISNQIPPAYVVGEPRFASKNNDTWHTNK